jgi:hypothetical protein
VTSAIVKVDKRHYRKIAQENWGLTNEQMKGMHVHHRLPQSQGGTHDSSNLYVCSPSFHAHAWHGEDSFLPLVENCSKAGKSGSREDKVRAGKIGGRRNVESGHLESIRTPESCSKGGKIVGKRNVESGHLKSVCSKGGKTGSRIVNSQKWKCLATGHVSNPGALSRYQKARGIDTSLRERVHPEPA